ncbi:MAG: 1-(5-phosphoribosyl)-5-[(5-phosphoribosylamino)methylideneamino]imidazole-4-carboxamide isomerase [Actinobacteria bacterium]|nr:1-(5-phosphoribosyl)-5-[(5-phosphoribosylamino)methylideneamino]imidazole-4-carboxamide isomerase [Actinomycetota bacterium]
MIIYPAIDIKEGRCVRLFQGKMDEVTVFSENPSEVAKKWESQGAEIIHLVDLDGAVAGEPKNLKVVEKIINSINIPVQFGGGIRQIKSLEMVFDIGVKRVVLGTSIISNLEFVLEALEKFKSRIIAGIDAKNGMVATKGWKEISNEKAVDVARRMEQIGVKRIIYTDIETDGTLKGPNIDGTRLITSETNISIIASGGISKLDDIIRLKELESLGVEGVIIGKALYSGAFSLTEAIKVGYRS